MSRSLRRRWALAALVAVCALAGAVAGALAASERYEAYAVLSVPVASGSDAALGQADLDLNDRLVNTYKEIAQGGWLRDRVRRRFPDLGDVQITFEPVPSTELVRLRVATGGRRSAKEAANFAAEALVAGIVDRAERSFGAARVRLERASVELADRLADLRLELEEARSERAQLRVRELLDLEQTRLAALTRRISAIDATQDARTRVTVSQLAGLPPARSWRRFRRPAAIGLILGGLGGVGLVLLLDRRRRRLYEARDISEAAGAPLLARLPGGALDLGHPSAAADQLRARFLTRWSAEARVNDEVLVTSAREGEGRSLVAARLGAALAEAGRRVVIVDADLAQGRLSEELGLGRHAGVADLLRHGRIEALDELLRPTDVAGLRVLPRGDGDGGTAALASSEMLGVLRRARGLADIVVVDAPALATTSDTLTLCAPADAVVLAMGPGSVPEEDLLDTVADIRSSGSDVLGIVVVGADGRRR